jgi:Aminoglycoside-2''-adenylyltransferase
MVRPASTKEQLWVECAHTGHGGARIQWSSMEGEDVLEVLDRLESAGIVVWLDGGWGVDALIGRQTRPHSDLDLAIARDDLVQAEVLLAGAGFRHDTEAMPGVPARFVMVDELGRQVDFHPLVFDAEGTGWQQLSATERAWGATRQSISVRVARSSDERCGVQARSFNFDFARDMSGASATFTTSACWPASSSCPLRLRCEICSDSPSARHTRRSCPRRRRCSRFPRRNRWQAPAGRTQDRSFAPAAARAKTRGKPPQGGAHRHPRALPASSSRPPCPDRVGGQQREDHDVVPAPSDI